MAGAAAAVDPLVDATSGAPAFSGGKRGPA
jgi:hypothetical protein